MKLLWETHTPGQLGGQRISLSISNDGVYYLTVRDGLDFAGVDLHPAKADELAVALQPGFDPTRDDPQQIAACEEPPHPDD